MLEELTIKNWALIEKLTLQFSEGLNVLSGETGAGKSILVGAVSLLLGARADTAAIRNQTDESVVAGVFRIDSDSEAAQWCRQHDIKLDAAAAIIRRTVKRSGRGSIYLQSSPITLAELREISSLLVDLHGQHQHQSLLHESNHLLLLDRHAGVAEETRLVNNLYTQLSENKQKLENMERDRLQRLREREMLAHAVEEITEANLQPGEIESLNRDISLLERHEELLDALEKARRLIGSDNDSALASLRGAGEAVEHAASIDNILKKDAERLRAVFYELQDIDDSIRERLGSINFRPDQLEESNERLATIKKLERKYGDSIETILNYLRQSQQQLKSLQNWEEDKTEVEKSIKQCEKTLLRRAVALSERRAEAAKTLGIEVEGILKTLGMGVVSFEVALSRKQDKNGVLRCGPTGVDEVAFRIAPNPGEPIAPLKDIGSGGEISRVMLALKTVLTESDGIDTLIFDEIDVGIGGEVAIALGEHLSKLAMSKQVFCVTHLALIAARGQRHFKVEKRNIGGRANTVVQCIEDTDRVEEISRMLAGDRESSLSRSHAEELLTRYSNSDR